MITSKLMCRQSNRKENIIKAQKTIAFIIGLGAFTTGAIAIIKTMLFWDLSTFEHLLVYFWYLMIWIGIIKVSRAIEIITKNKS